MIDDPNLPAVGVIRSAPGRLTWRVWAPRAERADLLLEGGPEKATHPMVKKDRGYFSVEVAVGDEARPIYRYALDGNAPLPDPLSRFQPDGVDGPSAVVFPGGFAWDEGGWKGIARDHLVISEVHVGTFTDAGTFEAIIPRIASLQALGITAIELMPVAQFPGARSWGYDGVFPFAVQDTYGGPEGLKTLIEACHRAGMAVLLDAVFNHFGPEGNALPSFGPYLTDKYKTAWGPALNFDDVHCDPVRAMVLDNVAMWIRDYRFDGLRLDAADQIFDRGPRHILREVAEVAHREASRLGRPVHVFAETDLNDAPRFLGQPDRGGYGLDGHWVDDFHHTVHATLTGEHNGYYEDFGGGVPTIAKVYTSIFFNDGIYSPFRKRRHGAPATMFDGSRFVAFTQNHDQVGNRAKSDRHAASLPASKVRASTGLLLLAPRIPLLFMGQEYGETAPFPFFADFRDPGLVEAVRKGRREEFAAFGWTDEVPDPFDASTFASARISWDWSDPVRQGMRLLTADLLALRKRVEGIARFALPTVEVSEDGQGGGMMVVAWDDLPGSRTRVGFNLSDAPRDWPEGVDAGSVLLRSEVIRYGAPSDPSGSDPIRPWEFFVADRR